MDEALPPRTAVTLGSGSVRKLNHIPAKLKKAFVTALDIAPADHIKALAAFPKNGWILPFLKPWPISASLMVGDMIHSYMLAYELGWRC